MTRFRYNAVSVAIGALWITSIGTIVAFVLAGFGRIVYLLPFPWELYFDGPGFGEYLAIGGVTVFCGTLGLWVCWLVGERMGRLIGGASDR